LLREREVIRRGRLEGCHSRENVTYLYCIRGRWSVRRIQHPTLHACTVCRRMGQAKLLLSVKGLLVLRMNPPMALSDQDASQTSFQCSESHSVSARHKGWCMLENTNVSPLPSPQRGVQYLSTLPTRACWRSVGLARCCWLEGSTQPTCTVAGGRRVPVYEDSRGAASVPCPDDFDCYRQ
jgi:hypothetical protein